MPLSIGKIQVDVSLCGAIPRSWSALSVDDSGGVPPSTPSSKQCQRLSDITSSDLNALRDEVSKCSCVATINGKSPSQHPTQTNRSKTTAQMLTGERFAPKNELNSQITTPTLSSMPNRTASLQLPMLEPPQWAVPARGDARLEPVCEAVGSHSKVDLTSRSFFRVGRSPGSDVQLLHNTSSRRHALLFHHPNGSCYVVDCGSSHGTYVNGVRVQSAPSGSMVVPHRVRRGSLIRFGGPGAPSFVLKSYSVGFSSMVKDLEEPSSTPTLSPSRRSDHPVVDTVMPTRIAPIGGQEGGILRKRSFEEPLPDAKRQRCVSPACNIEDGPFRLVSPESPRKSKRVSFLEKPAAVYPALVEGWQEEKS
mmetsp:Transcript_22155/g.51096  ORF Transcript_22155/g.51096 Transcript_22155/m.51096 type:complete len:364 (+) Transcript_22155:306-1397(+)